MSMSKSVILLPVLALLAGSCFAITKPAFHTTDTGDSWVSRAPMNVARAYPGIAVVNGKIYVIGGDSASANGPLEEISFAGNFGNNSDATEEYNPATDKWNLKTSMPTPRANFGIAVYQNKIYCMGGCTNDGETGVNEVYDPATDTWEIKRSMPFVLGRSFANVVGDKIYLIGSTSVYGTSANAVYDPATDLWTMKSLPPHETLTCVLGVIDERIYTIGTIFSKDPSDPRRIGWTGGFFQIYNTVNDSWSIGDKAPTYGMTAIASVASGAGGLKRIYLFEEDVTYIYCPDTNNWTTALAMPTPRYCAGVAAVNKSFYLIGGRTGNFGPPLTFMYPSKSNEQYTPIGYGASDPSASPAQSQEPQQLDQFPIMWLAAAVPAAVVSIILLIYLKKHHH